VSVLTFLIKLLFSASHWENNRTGKNSHFCGERGWRYE